MKILKLHGHKGNTGGIVNLQNNLKPYENQSVFQYLHFRTGKKQESAFLSNPFIRFLDQVLSYLKYPLYLLIQRPDVIEINSSLVPAAFKRDCIYAKLTKLVLPKSKLILFNHGWNYDFKSKLLKNKRKWKSCFNTYDEIIVLANAFKREIIEELQYSSEKIHTITTGINVSEYRNYHIQSRRSNKLNILFLSRIEKTKGIEELIKAIPIVLKKYPQTHFNIAGTGSYLKYIETSDVYIRNKDNITLKGYVRGQNKLKLLQESDVFAFPSFGEGCPVSVLEALAVGLPVIYTTVGALPDILNNQKHGILIKKKSVEELAFAIIKLIEDYELRNEISRNNIELSKKFDLKIIHSHLENIYIQE